MNELQQAYSAGGWLAAAGVAVSLAVKLYRSDNLQALLPIRYRWATLPVWARRFIVALAAFLAAALTALAAKMTVGAALLSSVPVFFTALATHKIAKSARRLAPRSKSRESIDDPSSLHTNLKGD